MKNTGIKALANAIKRGSQGRKKAIGELYYEGAVCALGAAYVGSFGIEKLKKHGDHSRRYTELRKRFPVLGKVIPSKFWPDGYEHIPTVKETVERMVINLNDQYKKSRTWIADYLTTLVNKVK